MPRLRRFYGGAAAEWLGMSWELVEAHLEELPKLQAAEALLGAAVAAVGTGSMRRHDLEATMRRWRRQAGRGERPARPKTREDFMSTLAAAGIGVRVVKKGEKRADG